MRSKDGSGNGKTGKEQPALGRRLAIGRSRTDGGAIGVSPPSPATGGCIEDGRLGETPTVPYRKKTDVSGWCSASSVDRPGKRAHQAARSCPQVRRKSREEGRQRGKGQVKGEKEERKGRRDGSGTEGAPSNPDRWTATMSHVDEPNLAGRRVCGIGRARARCRSAHSRCADRAPTARLRSWLSITARLGTSGPDIGVLVSWFRDWRDPGRPCGEVLGSGKAADKRRGARPRASGRLIRPGAASSSSSLRLS